MKTYRQRRPATLGSASIGQVSLVSLAALSLTAWEQLGIDMSEVVAERPLIDATPSGLASTPQVAAHLSAGVWSGVTRAERLLKARQVADGIAFPPRSAGAYPDIPVQLVAPQRVDDIVWHDALSELSQTAEAPAARERAGDTLRRADVARDTDSARWSAITVAALEDLRAYGRVVDDDPLSYLDDGAERAYFSLARPEVLAQLVARTDGLELRSHFQELLSQRGSLEGASVQGMQRVSARLDDALMRRLFALARVFERGDANLSPREATVARRSLDGLFGESGDPATRIYQALDISPTSFEGLEKSLAVVDAQGDWSAMLRYAFGDAETNAPSTRPTPPPSGQLPPDLLVGLFAEANALLGDEAAAIYRKLDRAGLTYGEQERFSVIGNTSPQVLSSPLLSIEDISESSRWFKNLVARAGGGRAAEQYARRVAVVKKLAAYYRDPVSVSPSADDLRLFGIETSP